VGNEKRDYLIITIGICVHNEEKNISDLLKSCFGSDYPKNKMEVIVIDDGSDDKTSEIVKEFENEVILIEIPRSGKATAINKLIEKAKGEIIIFVSGDCILRKDSISRVLERFDKEFGAITGRKFQIRDSNIASIFSKIFWDIHNETSMRNPKLCGDLFAIKKSIISKIPKDVVNDDAYIDSIVKRKGFGVKYNDKAIVEIYPYKKVSHYFQWRRRIITGYLQLKRMGL
jgi:cellulose synthase/poly-beta-1,6-N-acetylglucosamine synthase-like glycosyltransferase